MCSDSRRLAEHTLAPFGWPHARLARCLDAVEEHHALGSRWDWGVEVELVRRSDLVDVTRGLVAFGLPRSWLRELFQSVPRAGFYRMLGGAVGRMARERPAPWRESPGPDQRQRLDAPARAVKY